LRASYRRDNTRTNAGQSYVEVPSAEGPFPDLPSPFNEVTADQYTLGLRYLPMENLALRVSYGEGILPPASSQLWELDSLDILQWLFLTDPKRGGEPITTATVELATLLGSLALRPELSRSWSAGMVFTPAAVPGL